MFLFTPSIPRCRWWHWKGYSPCPFNNYATRNEPENRLGQLEANSTKPAGSLSAFLRCHSAGEPTEASQLSLAYYKIRVMRKTRLCLHKFFLWTGKFIPMLRRACIFRSRSVCMCLLAWLRGCMGCCAELKRFTVQLFGWVPIPFSVSCRFVEHLYFRIRVYM